MSANPETMEVQMQRSYHLNDEDDTEVDKENVAQGRHLMYLSRSSVTRSVSCLFSQSFGQLVT